MKEMLRLCAGALLASWLWPAAAETVSCSGGTVVLQDQTFSNVIATCIASNSIALGPAVRIVADADVVFAAPRILMQPGLRVERGAAASFSHISGQPRNQAVLGPLVGSSIAAYRLGDLTTPIETTTGLELRSRLELAGSFSLSLAGIPADEWILVAASGGKDIDADDSGTIDPAPTANNGTIHALARAADWRAGGLRINSLTDIAWRYTADWVGDVSLGSLGQRLDDVAKTLVKEDINGDGLINADDLLAFDPASAIHRNRLRFQFTDLFLPDGYIAQVHAGAGADAIETLLDGSFGAYLTFGDPLQQADEVTLRAVAFGDGRVDSDRGGLLIDSEQPVAAQLPSIVLTRGGAPVVLTATPTIDTEILGWEGCDWTSADLTQCRVDLLADRQVEIDFGQIDVVLKADFIDLSTATVLWTGDELDVTVDPLDVDLLGQMEGIATGTYVAGLADTGPFLRRVVGVAELGARHWLLQTVDATLDEVVEQGTGMLSRVLTHADLAPASLAAAQAVGSGSVYLLPPADPSDTVFRLRIGDAATTGSTPVAQAEASATFTWEKEGATLELSGGVDVEIGVDTGVSFSLWDGLQYFKFIPELSLTPELNVIVSGALETPKDDNGDDLWRKVLYTFKFTAIKFFVGPVPVWVTPEVAVYIGVNGRVEGRLEMGVGYSVSGRAGVVYKEGYWYTPHEFDHGDKVDPPTVTAAASLKGYVSSEPSLHLYSATGPGLTVETSLKASTSVGFDADCIASVDYGLYGGLEGAFKWDTPLGETKFGKLLKLDKVEFKFPILDWNRKLFGGVVNGCGSAPPVLMVAGDDLRASIFQGESKSLQTTYTLSNGGELSLPWSLYYNQDGVVEVTPTSGTLTAGEEALVTVSLANTAGLDQGRYGNLLQFKNDFEGAIGQSHLGSQEHVVSVDVLPPDFPRPFNVEGTRIATGAVQLWWDYDPAATHLLRGFRIWYTTDPALVTWSPSGDQIDPKARTGLATGLPSRYLYLSVEAFGVDPMLQQAFSEPVSVTGVAEPYPDYPLNDTGLDWCANASQNNLACPVSGFPGQDAESGRDVTHNDDSDGQAGFSFTKIANSGSALPNSAGLGSGANDWACTRDNVTGLIWEVKTDNGGLRDKDWTYSWYNPDAGTNGGSAGYADYGNNCFNTARCDTDKFVADVNAQGLCGASDWRLASVDELLSIVSNDRTNPSIDPAFFPNTPSSVFWSSSPNAYNSNYAWYVYFIDGYVDYSSKDLQRYVRLVRGGQ